MKNKNFRFKEIKLRAWNKNSKQMIYSNKENTFLINSIGFSIIRIKEDGEMEPLGDDTNSILMQCTSWKDGSHNEIYEGDVVFLNKPLKRGLFPVIGVVNAKDFSFSINSGLNHFPLEYQDKNIQILGNIFESSDEELAEKGEKLLKKYDSLKKELTPKK